MQAWPARVAGGLVVLLGLANAGLAVVSLTTDLIRLAPGTAGTLLTLGLATIAIGALVSRGSRAATTVGLIVFGLLLVAQLVGLVSDVDADAGTRVAILGVVVAALALTRSRSSAGDADQRSQP